MVNGPNLDLLGLREAQLYGSDTLLAVDLPTVEILVKHLAR